MLYFMYLIQTKQNPKSKNKFYRGLYVGRASFFQPVFHVCAMQSKPLLAPGEASDTICCCLKQYLALYDFQRHI